MENLPLRGQHFKVGVSDLLPSHGIFPVKFFISTLLPSTGC